MTEYFMPETIQDIQDEIYNTCYILGYSINTDKIERKELENHLSNLRAKLKQLKSTHII